MTRHPSKNGARPMILTQTHRAAPDKVTVPSGWAV